MSADGRYVVYDSGATTLVENPDANSVLDVFLYDRVTETTTGIQKTYINAQGNICGRGDTAAFNP